MGWLFIDTHLAGTFRFGLLEAGKQAAMRSKAGRSSRFLVELAKAWPNWKNTVTGICVVEGPGSFSAVRTGVLHANLLSRLLGKPLVGIRVGEDDPIDTLAERLEKNLFPERAYVAPVYDAEPNITKPRT